MPSRHLKIAVLVALLGFVPAAHSAQAASSSPTSAIASNAATANVSRRFSVTVEGSGKDIILIPGLASSAVVWENTAARLRGQYRVHLIQVNGFAGAAAGQNAEGLVVAPLVEDLAAYINANHLAAPIVIGHSLGGEAALMLAARHPKLPGRIVTIDALPFFPLTIDPRASVDSVRPQADAMRTAMLGMSREQFDAGQAMSAARMVKNEAARKGIVAAGVASDQSVVARAVHELMTTDLRSELGAITVPAGIVYAYDTSYGVPESIIDELFRSAYANLKTAKLTRVNDTYHFIMYDQPDRLAEALTALIGGRAGDARPEAADTSRH